MLRPNLKANDFLVAESASMQAVVAQVADYADNDAPVLICCEHGTGRELGARVLHPRSRRNTGRFIAVRPSFEDAPVDRSAPVPTDACERARGALRSAAGGTLLVKDMSVLSATSQRTLKRAIRDPDEAYDVHVVATGDLEVEKAVDAKTVSYTHLRAH